MNHKALILCALQGAIASAGAAGAQQFNSGEIALSYGSHDFDNSKDTASYGLRAATDYGFGNGFGMQFGLGYQGFSETELGFTDYFADAHLYYRTMDGLKIGTFLGYGELAPMDFGGGPDLGNDIVTYGIEALYDFGPVTVNTFSGAATNTGSALDSYVFYGAGADYALNGNWEVTGDYKDAYLDPDAPGDDLRVQSLSLGLNYYTGSVMSVPMRLSASVGKDWVDYDSLGGDDSLSFGLSATFTFGGSGRAGESDKLFDSYVSPF